MVEYRFIDFDEVVSKEGDGAGIWVRSCKNDTNLCFCKLYIDCTNNVAEYEALVLGIIILKDLKTKKIYVYGNLELVINQVKGVYQEKHPRMRSYGNLVLDLLENIVFQLFIENKMSLLML